MKISAIYLDMDGVLVDLVGEAFKLYNINDPKAREEVVHWGAMPEAISKYGNKHVSTQDFWKSITCVGTKFWSNMSWLPWGKELYQWCNEQYPTVLMSKPTSHPTSAAGKMEWINKNIPSAKRFALTSCKHHMAHPGAVLIDDSEDNIEKFVAHGGKGILFPGTWNRLGTPDPSRVMSMIKEEINKIAAQ